MDLEDCLVWIYETVEFLYQEITALAAAIGQSTSPAALELWALGTGLLGICILAYKHLK